MIKAAITMPCEEGVLHHPAAPRDDVRRNVFVQARDRGQFPADTDPDVLLDLLTGAGWQHLAVHPDTCTVEDAEQFLRAVLHQAGYRPDGSRDKE